MKSSIVVIGAGASGLMAAYWAAKALVNAGSDAQVTVLEKNPRAARKLMITGKGRCNFTNVKPWNEFSGHIQSGERLVKSAFYNFTPEQVIDFFDSFGMASVVERGDRAFPESYHAGDVVDTLVNACFSVGVKIEYEFDVDSVTSNADHTSFTVSSKDGRSYICHKLIIATGGLSYPSTGSTGDGYRWSADLGHKITTTFPSLTALVPRGYKLTEAQIASREDYSGPALDELPSDGKHHIHRSTPLSETGEKLLGISLKNIGVKLYIQDTVAQEEFGDIDFTDGGIEGPIGFQLSRKAVKAMVNGSKIALELDLKPGVSLTELTTRVRELWTEVDHDPRSVRMREKEKCRIMLGKLMPWDLIPAFTALHPEIMTLERKSRTETKVWINIVSIAKALKAWRFDIAGYVGYERAVVTAGGVSLDEILPKTLESRICPGLYLCGEVLDVDADTGGFNIQCAFATGRLAGESAAKSLINK